MSTLLSPARVPSPTPTARSWLGPAAVALAGTGLALAARAPGALGVRFTGVTVAFLALLVESLPFLLAGAVLVALLQRGSLGGRVIAAAAGHPRLAAALAPLSGTVLPLCDCGLLPVARQLHAGGVGGRAVNGFVSGAPLTNPIVILSTLVAFPGSPGMVVGRVVVGLSVAMIVSALARPREAHVYR